MVTTTTFTTWNPTTHEEYDRLKGRDVYSRDDEKVGTIDAIFHPEQAMPQARGGHYFLVTPGTLKSLFGADEAYVPESAIAEVTADRVTLSVAKDQLTGQGWATKPPGLDRFRRS